MTYYNFLFFIYVAKATFANIVKDQLSLKNLNDCGSWELFESKLDRCVTYLKKRKEASYDTARQQCLMDSRSNYGYLVTLGSENDQWFVEKILIGQNISKNVWLGLIKNRITGNFVWSDRTELTFTNWMATEDANEKGLDCVELIADADNINFGKWIKVSCYKKNLIVCERKVVWDMLKLQSIVRLLIQNYDPKHINSQLSTYETKISNHETKISNHETKILNHETEISTIKSNIENLNSKASSFDLKNTKAYTMPHGMVYVQYPGNESPEKLWPDKKWKDVSTDRLLNGYFLRIDPNHFNELDEGWFPSIKLRAGNVTDNNCYTDAYLNHNQFDSYQYLVTGGGEPETCLGFKYEVSALYVKPRSTSLKIWKKIGN